MKEIKLENPNNLEITAAIVKSKDPNAKNLTIITIAIYSPPRSKKKSKLLDMIASTYQKLKLKYPDAYFLCGGDVNDLKWEELESLNPNMRQCVTKATRKGKILSVILTDLHPFYQEVEILPPLLPDKEGNGKPSDHSTPIIKVFRSQSSSKKSSFSIKTVRPIKTSDINKFGNWIGTEKFEEVEEKETPDEKVKTFREMMNAKIEEIFPTKQVKVFHRDKEFMTERLHKLQRAKEREYRKNKKSKKYL